MKKSLLALAVLSAFAGAASAQSSVTVYGIVDAAVTRFDDGTDTTTGISSGQQSSSRIGFKGTEDLGNGLKAFFTLENGISVDTGAGSSGFSRQANVGLKGGFGSVALGLNNSAMKRAIDKLDAFGNGGLVGLAGIYGTNERVANSIHYVSPNFGGFSGALTYGFGEVAGENKANRNINASATYAAGPVALHLTHGQENEDVPTESDNTKMTVFGGSYDFGVAKLFASYAQEKEDFAAGDTKVKGFNLGVSAPVGAGKVLASFTRVKDDDNSEDKFNEYAVGYVHSMSKRTSLYATYARVSNGDDSGRWAAVDGDSANRLALGVKHAF